MVVHGIAGSLRGCELQPMGFCLPLTAQELVATHQRIVIIYVGTGLDGLQQHIRPMLPVNRIQLMQLCLATFIQNVQYQFFTEGRLILQIK